MFSSNQRYLSVRRMKICTKCHKKKDNALFCKDSKSKDGLQSQCKACKSSGLTNYYKHNPEKRHALTKEYMRRRYYDDRVHWNISRLVRKGLCDYVKSSPTFSLLGYSVEELKHHLESQFHSGMTWENYGEWHIDHKIPRSKLPYDSPLHPNFLQCWKLSNLQPLWAGDNIRKRNRMAL